MFNIKTTGNRSEQRIREDGGDHPEAPPVDSNPFTSPIQLHCLEGGGCSLANDWKRVTFVLLSLLKSTLLQLRKTYRHIITNHFCTNVGIFTQIFSLDPSFKSIYQHSWLKSQSYFHLFYTFHSNIKVNLVMVVLSNGVPVQTQLAAAHWWHLQVWLPQGAR